MHPFMFRVAPDTQRVLKGQLWTLNQDVEGKKQSEGNEVGRRVFGEGAQQGEALR